jgi:hypothetical protein
VKTATKYSQGIFAQHEEILSIAKCHKSKYYSEELRFFQDRLFEPPLPKLQGYNPHNSTQRIDNYAKLIVEEIEKSNLQNLVLSDEAILAYGVYNAELNQFLLARLIKRIEEIGAFSFHSKTLLLTIREQSSWLQSHFAYQYIHWSKYAKNENQLIKMLRNDPFKGPFGTIWYDEISLTLEQFFPEFDINILPYEHLESNEQFFVDSLFQGLITTNPAAPSLPVNINSIEINESRKNFVRKPTILSYLIWQANFIGHLHKYIRVTGLLNIISENKKMHARKIIKKIQPKILYNTNEALHFSDETNTIIRETYSESNMNLNKRYGLGLEKLGYGT